VTRGVRPSWAGLLLAGLLAAGFLTACRDNDPAVDRATREAARAVDEQVGGTFLDYYEEVLRLAHQYGAQPDSFRVALDALPGSHLTDEEWADWTAPYSQDPAPLAERLEKVIAALGAPR
jgi:hypothetical protein